MSIFSTATGYSLVLLYFSLFLVLICFIFYVLFIMSKKYGAFARFVLKECLCSVFPIMRFWDFSFLTGIFVGL